MTHFSHQNEFPSFKRYADPLEVVYDLTVWPRNDPEAVVCDRLHFDHVPKQVFARVDVNKWKRIAIFDNPFAPCFFLSFGMAVQPSHLFGGQN